MAETNKPSSVTPARPKARIESLSDMIFGLALSVGAITLVGNVSSITTPSILVNDVLIFGFSFLILITVWIRYTRTMSALHLEDSHMGITLNTALLFTVSLEPFLFNVLNLGVMQISDFASIAYAVDLGVMMGILGGFTLVLTDEDRKLVPKDMIRDFKTESAIMFLMAALFLISIAIPFDYIGPAGVRWRYILWLLPFVISGTERRGRSIVRTIKRRRQRRAEKRQLRS